MSMRLYFELLDGEASSSSPVGSCASPRYSTRVKGRLSLRSLLIALICLPLTAIAADMTTIARGERVDLHAHIDGDAHVLFDFYADWCAPCRALEPTLQRLAAADPDRLVIRKIDIIDWQSPVVAQHGIRSIPHLKLYAPDGALVAQGSAATVLAALSSRLGISDAGPRDADRDRTGTLIGLGIVVALIVVGFGLSRASGRDRSDPAPPDARAASAEHGSWYVMHEGDLDGPYTDEQLATLRENGRLGDDHQVRRKGDRQWRTLASVVNQDSVR